MGGGPLFVGKQNEERCATGGRPERVTLVHHASGSAWSIHTMVYRDTDRTTLPERYSISW